MIQVISGFPGVGKTELYKDLVKRGYKVRDSDSSLFDKEHFPENYLDDIEEKKGQGFIVLVSSHEEVRLGMEERGIDYILAYPNIALKEEYLERYRRRGSPDEFVSLLGGKWEEFIEGCHNSQATKHWVLDSGEYLSDMMKDI